MGDCETAPDEDDDDWEGFDDDNSPLWENVDFDDQDDIEEVY